MPSLEFEEVIFKESGLRLVAGLDEAGRGAVAGPVVAAAVILPLTQPRILEALQDVDDSKQLSSGMREQLYPLIMKHALSYGIGSCSAELIDEIGIIPATKQAMLTALSRLSPAAEYLLIDGRIQLKRIPLPQMAIIRGDSKSLSIAAASILAKVTRDHHMCELDAVYPGYGFAQHKGYGTRQHRDHLLTIGPTPVHRYSFAPLRQRLL